jgi:dTMP kinase
MTGFFLTIEGPEGAGKSTQARRLASALEVAGHSVVLTREPGGTEIGETIRTILLEQRNHAMLAETEALLHTAARSQHVGEKIRPALANGQIVVCDRFVDSTLAYQGGGRGIAIERLGAIQEIATGGLKPDLKILLDLPVEVGLARRFGASGEINRMDAAGEDFHRRVRATFLQLADEQPDEWIVIDASRNEAEVTEGLIRAVASRTDLLPTLKDIDFLPGASRAVADV